MLFTSALAHLNHEPDTIPSSLFVQHPSEPPSRVTRVHQTQTYYHEGHNPYSQAYRTAACSEGDSKISLQASIYARLLVYLRHTANGRCIQIWSAQISRLCIPTYPVSLKVNLEWIKTDCCEVNHYYNKALYVLV